MIAVADGINSPITTRLNLNESLSENVATLQSHAHTLPEELKTPLAAVQKKLSLLSVAVHKLQLVSCEINSWRTAKISFKESELSIKAPFE
jgi:hypothetical protein